MVWLNMSPRPFVARYCCVVVLLDTATFPVLIDSALVGRDGLFVGTLCAHWFWFYGCA